RGSGRLHPRRRVAAAGAGSPRGSKRQADGLGLRRRGARDCRGSRAVLRARERPPRARRRALAKRRARRLRRRPPVARGGRDAPGTRAGDSGPRDARRRSRPRERPRGDRRGGAVGRRLGPPDRARAGDQGPRQGGGMGRSGEVLTYGPYGGRFVPETLIPALDELEAGWREAQEDSTFAAELDGLGRNYAGRPTPLTRAERFGHGKRL